MLRLCGRGLCYKRLPCYYQHLSKTKEIKHTLEVSSFITKEDGIRELSLFTDCNINFQIYLGKVRKIYLQPPQIFFGRIDTWILRLKSTTDIVRQPSSEIVVNRLQQSLPEYHSQTMSSVLHRGLSMITIENPVKNLKESLYHRVHQKPAKGTYQKPAKEAHQKPAKGAHQKPAKGPPPQMYKSH